LELLDDKPCYGGLDLSSTQDITALVLVFPSAFHDAEGPLHAVAPAFFMPEDVLAERARADKVPYERWVAEGFIEATEGNAVDYDLIGERVMELAGRFRLQEVGYDPWNALHLTQQLLSRGVPMVPLTQGYALSPACKELERLVTTRRLAHAGHPVLRWMADAVEVQQDARENIRLVKPDRRASSKRIDGIAALVMAIARWLVHEGPQEPPELVSF
jgi:phage terminase large subunit-like protein